MKIQLIIARIVVFAALAYAFGMLAAKNSKAEASNLTLKEDPAISVYQGTERGTSVIVLQWPDGKTERLVIKNGDKEGFLVWFNERLDVHGVGK